MSDTNDRGDWSGRLAITGMGLVTPVGLRADAQRRYLLARYPAFEGVTQGLAPL